MRCVSVLDEDGIHAVANICLNVKRVAGASGNAAGWVLRNMLRGEGRDELRVIVVEQAHVPDFRVVGSGHDLQEVVVFRDALDAVSGELEHAQLQLAFHDRGRRDVGEGFARVLEIGDVVLSGFVESHDPKVT